MAAERQESKRLKAEAGDDCGAVACVKGGASLRDARDPLEVRPEECQVRARTALEDPAALSPGDVHVLASDVLSLSVRVLTLEDRLRALGSAA